MRRINRFSLALTGLLLAALACNLPVSQPPATSDPNVAFTAAALTVAAHLTASAPILFTPTTVPATAIPTNTSIGNAPTIAPPPTAIPTIPTQDCDKAAFVADMTIPDGTILAKDQAFTKTWRLKNTGTCSWTPSYAVVFFSGDSMSGPAVQALTGNVNPGQSMDISINLKAPSSNGKSTGYWKLRNASGVTFSQFYVTIKVQGGGGGGANVIIQASIAAEDGQVRSNGQVLDAPIVGDTATNVTIEGFLSFDISGIPASATVTKVVLDFSNFDTVGHPFNLSDGCLRAYVDDYGSLGAGDFYAGDPLGAVARWCSWAELSTASEQPDLIGPVQARLGTGRLQLRIQFRTPTTNNNFTLDAVRLLSPQIKIYYTP